MRAGVEEIEIPAVVEDAEQEAATGEATTEDGDAGTAETEAPTTPGQDTNVDNAVKARKSMTDPEDVNEEGDVSISPEIDVEPTLEMPASWVPKMVIAQEDFDNLPKGSQDDEVPQMHSRAICCVWALQSVGWSCREAVHVLG